MHGTPATNWSKVHQQPSEAWNSNNTVEHGILKIMGEGTQTTSETWYSRNNGRMTLKQHLEHGTPETN
jgi:hypothetical protein